MTSPLVQSTWDSDTSFVPGVIRRSNCATISSSGASGMNSAKPRSTPKRSATMYSGPTPPGCSWQVVTARPPSLQSIAHVPMFMPSVAAWVIATSSSSAPRIAATPARASSIRCLSSSQYSAWARPKSRSYSASWAIAAADSAGIGPTEPVFSWIAAESDGSAARTAASLSTSDMNGETTHL